jgi:hypothetical protein
MLTDIFAYRYADVPMWDAFEERDRRFIVQAYRIVEEQLFQPYSDSGKKNDWADAKWKLLHDRLSSELGLKELSQRVVGYYAEFMGKRNWTSFTKPWHTVCEEFLCSNYDPSISADEFIKIRLSFFEIAFREKEQDIAARRARGVTPTDELVAQLLAQGKHKGPMSDKAYALSRLLTDEGAFQASVDELNTRLQQAGYKLNYHNGYIQRSVDEQVEAQIETPFWALVADPKWRNVETDMATAIDVRDTGGRDPAWHAAKALESTIKIISNDNGWTHGKENGPHNYIENLASKRNGHFIDGWEMTSLKQFFTDVRRPFGHGAGSDEMPKLTDQQTNWAIEFCMTWIKSLIERAGSAGQARA